MSINAFSVKGYKGWRNFIEPRQGAPFILIAVPPDPCLRAVARRALLSCLYPQRPVRRQGDAGGSTSHPYVPHLGD